MAEKVSTGGRGGLFPFTLLFGALYASFGVMSPFLPTLLQDRGLTAKEIGVVLALSTVARLVSGPLAGRTADLLAALRGVFATFAVAAALSGLGYVPAHAFWTVLAVSVLYAAMLAPLTTIADALALAAAGPAGEAGRRFEYGLVRGAGSAAFIAGSILAGQAIVIFNLNVIVWGSSIFLVAAGAAVMILPPARAATSTETKRSGRASLGALLGQREFRLLITVAALVLGSHAMHDSFAMIRWSAAGISPPTASVLWSESVAAEVAVFVVIGPRLLIRIGPTGAMTIAAAAGAVRWSVMAITADVAAMALVEPLHGLSFALLHLACMRLLGRLVPPSLTATAQAIYGTVAIGIVSALLTMASGTLYGTFGAGGFWAMAVLCVAALPFIAGLARINLKGETRNSGLVKR
jgi:PPP family 3-phenylpropionic acid transporter